MKEKEIFSNSPNGAPYPNTTAGLLTFAYVDHYDSFSFNIIDWLLSHTPQPLHLQRVCYDDSSAMTALAQDNLPFVISPGPKAPADVPSTKQLVKALLGKLPIFGICLGHQILGEVAGMAIQRSQHPLHGTVKTIKLVYRNGLFALCPEKMRVAAYHSLIVVPPSPLPLGWTISARCSQGEVMAMEFSLPGHAPAAGVQFHPESFLTEEAKGIKDQWLLCLKQFTPQGSRA